MADINLARTRTLGSGVQPDSKPAYTATAVGVTFTWSANDPAVTDGAATIADGDTVGNDNDAGDAISALEDQVNKLVVDVAALETILSNHGLLS